MAAAKPDTCILFHRGRRERTPASCPLPSTHMYHGTSMFSCIHRHIHGRKMDKCQRNMSNSHHKVVHYSSRWVFKQNTNLSLGSTWAVYNIHTSLDRPPRKTGRKGNSQDPLYRAHPGPAFIKSGLLFVFSMYSNAYQFSAHIWQAHIIIYCLILASFDPRRGTAPHRQLLWDSVLLFPEPLSVQLCACCLFGIVQRM